MATTIRAELSTGSEWHVDKHRYYELKHFCLQYPDWKRAYSKLVYLSTSNSLDEAKRHKDQLVSPMDHILEERLLLRKKIDLVEVTASMSAGEIASYILTAVTEGLSFPHIKARLEIPCGKDMFYDRYRRFFWLLDRRENDLIWRRSI